MSYMSDYKYSIKNTTKIEREKLQNIALSYSTLDAAAPSEDTMKLVEEYVVGNIEIADALESVIEKYRDMGLQNV
ncbi:hypothetical protein BAU14_02045 [Enterococcus sp. CU9D]|nr:hypothetical protein BAU14_02045 [Enterococcus sp. CU9D]